MSEDLVQHHSPKEGEVYKELWICGKFFRLVYGYYEEFERESPFNEPMPIYPDFIKNPLYTQERIPFVTAMQDICQHYKGTEWGDSCSDCEFFIKSEDLFGFCHQPANRPESVVGNDHQTHPAVTAQNQIGRK